jgi:hypothetical protein
MGGTAGKFSFEVVVAVVGRVVLVVAGIGIVGGGVVEAAFDGQAGALLSAASDVPLVLVRGGTPSGDWLSAFAAAREGAGPSLIFTYK